MVNTVSCFTTAMYKAHQRNMRQIPPQHTVKKTLNRVGHKTEAGWHKPC